uniref:4-amino-4-deoxy-L-arabinose transferase and related glycosyltransferases of PMT family-like protein n=1 Tax=Solibacter usitatus (strain Ellin6076) TaxID=234267 RepID=Q01T36_SOLUE
MQQVLGILLGALISGGASYSLGTLLFRKLNLRLERTEYISLAFVAGSACFSEIIFVLCALGLARKDLFVALALLAALVAICTRRNTTHISFAPLPIRWIVPFALLFAAFGIVYLVNALAPEMSPDGSAYHLPFVARYLRGHGFSPIGQNFYANLPQGVELLFLPAFSLGGPSASAMVHFLFLLNLPLMMVSYGRRFGFPFPALAAAFLIFASPIFGWDGTSAYVDVAAAAILFALFYLLGIWQTGAASRLLVPIGILAGFSFAAKYTAAIGIPYALGIVIWTRWRTRKPVLRPVLAVCGVAALFILPWMIKNQIFGGNPFAPFANRLFPNPYVHVSFEEQYRLGLRHYLLPGWLHAPWELTVKGERLQGFFGPLFLLLPLALLSLRGRQGRRLALAGAIFALPWFLNIGTRFLIPALPPLTLALALALRSPTGLLPAIALLHAVLSWYATPFRFYDPYAPRLSTFPFRAALRLEPEAAYLTRNRPDYQVDRMIERHVPPGEKVFSFEPVAAAWTTREILAAYTGAQNEVLSDTLSAPLSLESLPLPAQVFRFEPRQLRRLRAILTAPPNGEMWSVNEFQIFAHGTLLHPDATWRLTANPNPWDAPLAFDNSPVTRWRSWDRARPGMFMEVDFGRPLLIDEVRLVSAPDAPPSPVELRAADARGQWRPLTSRHSTSSVRVTDNLRQASVRAVVARGIRYLLVTPGAFGANDFNENPREWGIQLLGESAGRRLYALKPAAADRPPPDPDPAPTPHRAVSTGTYDDPDSRICLHAAWTRDTQFPDADRHTLTYSNVTGASLSLTFQGDAITYVYTRAFNRGIAEIFVDGRLKDRPDLYSADTRWKSRTRYECLGPGTHVIQIRVTGEHNPRACDSFIDLDSLIIE